MFGTAGWKPKSNLQRPTWMALASVVQVTATSARAIDARYISGTQPRQLTWPQPADPPLNAQHSTARSSDGAKPVDTGFAPSHHSTGFKTRRPIRSRKLPPAYVLSYPALVPSPLVFEPSAFPDLHAVSSSPAPWLHMHGFMKGRHVPVAVALPVQSASPSHDSAQHAPGSIRLADLLTQLAASVAALDEATRQAPVQSAMGINMSTLAASESGSTHGSATQVAQAALGPITMHGHAAAAAPAAGQGQLQAEGGYFRGRAGALRHSVAPPMLPARTLLPGLGLEGDAGYEESNMHVSSYRYTIDSQTGALQDALLTQSSTLSTFPLARPVPLPRQHTQRQPQPAALSISNAWNDAAGVSQGSSSSRSYAQALLLSARSLDQWPHLARSFSTHLTFSARKQVPVTSKLQGRIAPQLASVASSSGLGDSANADLLADLTDSWHASALPSLDINQDAVAAAAAAPGTAMVQGVGKEDIVQAGSICHIQTEALQPEEQDAGVTSRLEYPSPVPDYAGAAGPANASATLNRNSVPAATSTGTDAALTAISGAASEPLAKSAVSSKSPKGMGLRNVLQGLDGHARKVESQPGTLQSMGGQGSDDEAKQAQAVGQDILGLDSQTQALQWPPVQHDTHEHAPHQDASDSASQNSMLMPMLDGEAVLDFDTGLGNASAAWDPPAGQVRVPSDMPMPEGITARLRPGYDNLMGLNRSNIHPPASGTFTEPALQMRPSAQSPPIKGRKGQSRTGARRGAYLPAGTQPPRAIKQHGMSLSLDDPCSCQPFTLGGLTPPAAEPWQATASSGIVSSRSRQAEATYTPAPSSIDTEADVRASAALDIPPGLVLRVLPYCIGHDELLEGMYGLDLVGRLAWARSVQDADVVVRRRALPGEKQHAYESLRRQAAEAGKPFVSLWDASRRELVLSLLPVFRLYGGWAAPEEVTQRWSAQAADRQRRNPRIRL